MRYRYDALRHLASTGNLLTHYTKGTRWREESSLLTMLSAALLAYFPSQYFHSYNSILTLALDKAILGHFRTLLVGLLTLSLTAIQVILG